jgi:hypothetical protein
MTRVGFEPAIPVSERPQGHALVGTGTVQRVATPDVINYKENTVCIFWVSILQVQTVSKRLRNSTASQNTRMQFYKVQYSLR